MSFWGELKRRDVFKVAIAYLVASWLIIQVVGVLSEPLSLPDILDTVVVVLLAIGFPFALIVAWVYDVTPEGVKVTPAADSAQPASNISGKRLTYVVVALIVAALGLTALRVYVLTPSSTGFGPGSRLAILPCDDLSPDPSHSYFAAGIHEELLNRMALLSGLDVVSRTSVMQYEVRRPAMPDIARALNADAIIECSARYAGDRVQLTVQLIDGPSDTHIWVEAYSGDMSSPETIFEIQADIAMQVANALHVQFLDAEREQIERVGTQSREAYELYLAALEFYRRHFSSGRLEDINESVSLLEQAVALDSAFIDAWRAKSGAHFSRAGFLSASQAEAELQASLDALDKAIGLAPDSPEARIERANVLELRGDWIEAELAVRRAIDLSGGRLNPGRATFWAIIGRWDKVLPQYQDEVDSNPQNHVAAGVLLLTYGVLGDLEARRREWERGERLYDDQWFGLQFESIFRLSENDLEFLHAYGPRMVQYHPSGSVWETGIANLESPIEGLIALRALYARAENRTPLNLANMAAWAAHFDDTALATQWLRESVEFQRNNFVTAWMPVFAEVRRTQEFKELLLELALPEYWKRFDEWPVPPFCGPLGEDDFRCE